MMASQDLRDMGYTESEALTIMDAVIEAYGSDIARVMHADRFDAFLRCVGTVLVAERRSASDADEVAGRLMTALINGVFTEMDLERLLLNVMPIAVETGTGHEQIVDAFAGRTRQGMYSREAIRLIALKLRTELAGKQIT